MSHLTAEDLHSLACHLVDRHGATARNFAARAVGEMEGLGDERRTVAWRALASLVDDVVAGRLPRRRTPLTQH